MPLDQYVSEIASSGDGERGGAVLVVASADQCAACVRQAASWPELIPALRSDDEVVAVSFVGERLVQPMLSAAAARQLRWRHLRVTDASAFAVRSGIGGTPTVVLLDATGFVRFSIEEINAATLEGLRDASQRLREPAGAPAASDVLATLRGRR